MTGAGAFAKHCGGVFREFPEKKVSLCLVITTRDLHKIESPIEDPALYTPWNFGLNMA